MPLAQIITFWRPGSADWSWADEYRDLISSPGTALMSELVESEGIGFADDLTPILLGIDGRVWDGHHRICIAIRDGIDSLMVEVVPHTDDDHPSYSGEMQQ